MSDLSKAVVPYRGRSNNEIAEPSNSNIQENRFLIFQPPHPHGTRHFQISTPPLIFEYFSSRNCAVFITARVMNPNNNFSGLNSPSNVFNQQFPNGYTPQALPLGIAAPQQGTSNNHQQGHGGQLLPLQGQGQGYYHHHQPYNAYQQQQPPPRQQWSYQQQEQQPSASYGTMGYPNNQVVQDQQNKNYDQNQNSNSGYPYQNYPSSASGAVSHFHGNNFQFFFTNPGSYDVNFQLNQQQLQQQQQQYGDQENINNANIYKQQ